MLNVDPIELSRSLGRAEDSANAWHDRLTEIVLPGDLPLQSERALLCQDGYDQIREALHESDPLRPHLLRWVAHLLEQRVNAAMYVECAELTYHEIHKLVEPERVELTVDQLKRLLLSDKRRKEWLQQLSARASRLSQAQQLLWQRRVEVYRRLKGPSLDEAELPMAGVYELANWVLERTQPLVERAPSFLVSLERGLSNPALTFPAHLSAAPFVDWFRETRLLEEPKLRPFSFPPLVNAGSFGIALERFGAELFRSFAPKSQPFVIAYDPLRLNEWTAGFLFARLLTNSSFQRRHLGSAPSSARDVTRVWAQIALHEVRLRAVRVLVRQALQLFTKDRAAAFEALGEKTWGEPLGGNLLAVLPNVRAHDAQRLCAIGLAHALNEDFTDRHNEDWYRNPRAEEELRSIAGRPPETQANPDVVRAALGRYLDEIEKAQ
jgi:hypothetical protein